MTDQHVQPVQSLAPDRRGSRRRTAVAVVAPAVILFVVAGAGMLGRVGAPTDGAPAEAQAIDTVPTATLSPSAQPDWTRLAAVDFPATALGLPVEPVQEVVGRLRRGLPGPAVVAVSGWLSIRPAADTCRSEAAGVPTAVLCPRETLLVSSPEPILEVGAGGSINRLRQAGPHLHPVALPGVSLRYLAARQYNSLDMSLMPASVVLIGRIADPRLPECRPSGRHCGEAIALERIVWVDGETLDVRATGTIRPAPRTDISAPERAELVEAAVPGSGPVLSEINLDGEQLARVDREASRALPGGVDGPIWYVRFLVEDDSDRPGAGSDAGWAVIDDASGEVVAVGSRTETTGATPNPSNLP